MSNPEAQPTTDHTIVHEPRYWLITVLAVVLTAAIAGGGVWWWMNKQIESVNNQLTERIQQLESKANMPSASNELEQQESEPLDNAMSGVFETKTYQNSEYGLQIGIPQNWEALVNSAHDSVKYDISFRDKKWDKSFEWPGLNIAYESESEGLAGARRFSFNQEVNEVIAIYFSEGDNHVRAKCSFYGLSGQERDDMLAVCNSAVQSLSFSASKSVSTQGWQTHQSALFSISFKYPSGFDLQEQANIFIAKGELRFSEIGSSNSFFTITKNKSGNIGLLKNLQESNIAVDGRSAIKYIGDDYGRYEGDSAGKVMDIVFDDFSIHVEERPGNITQDFDVIEIANQIISTINFSS